MGASTKRWCDVCGEWIPETAPRSGMVLFEQIDNQPPVPVECYACERCGKAVAAALIELLKRVTVHKDRALERPDRLAGIKFEVRREADDELVPKKRAGTR